MDLKKPIALISVSNKAGVLTFARALLDLGYGIVSTGGTADYLERDGIKLIRVQDLTNFPEMLDGRVKTLHPKIHGGILYKRSREDHRQQVRNFEIPSIDIVAVNLYPFQETIQSNPEDLEHILENIDIGGPTLLRAAAKNHRDVLVIVNPEDYTEVITSLREGGLLLSKRRELAVKVFAHTSRYDRCIENFLASSFLGKEQNQIYFEDGQDLGKYAENWHQAGKMILDKNYKGPSILHAKQVHGSNLGYNNFLDADTALNALLEFRNSDPCTVVVKHGNPCGMAIDNELLHSLERAWQGDPTSAFGSVIAMNRVVTMEILEALTSRTSSTSSKGWFVEVLAAPSFDKEALEWIKTKKSKANMRLLQFGDLDLKSSATWEFRSLRGGLLLQEGDIGSAILENSQLMKDAFEVEGSNGDIRTVGIVCGKIDDAQTRELFDFTNRVTKHLKSNAIGIGRLLPEGGFQLLGAGMGQPNRKDSAQLAIDRAIQNLKSEFLFLTGEGSCYEKAVLQSQAHLIGSLRESGMDAQDYVRDQLSMHCVAASDAFFPFSDGIEQLAAGGIRKIIQPGGSIRDKEIIDTAQAMELTMVFTGMRHFKH